MLTHQTFQNEQGKWLFPTDVTKGDNGQWLETANGAPVKVGAVIKMSKSKKNVVDPAQIINSYGADAARLFVMSDSPPEKDFEWTTAGIDGAWRFVNKIHRQVQEMLQHLQPAHVPMPAIISPEALGVRKKLHAMIAVYTTDLASFNFNRAIARLREFNNIYLAFKPQNAADYAVVRECLECQVQLLNPIMPHVTEELWANLGHTIWLVHSDWPVADPVLAKPDNVTIAVQINGKLRHTISVAEGLDSTHLEHAALNDDRIKNLLVGQTIRKIVAVPNRLINIVAG
jgi:leucyl-tRNA synthetase